MSVTTQSARPGSTSTLLSRFDAVPERQRILAARNLRSFCSADLCLALADRSFSRRSADPKAALGDAEAAVAIAEHLASRSASRETSDLCARAHGEFGNCLRIQDDLVRAGRAFEVARAALELGSGALFLRAHILKLHASLFRAQGEYAEAGRLLDESIGLFARTDRSEMVGAMVGRALVYGCQEQPAHAVELLAKAIRLLDPHDDKLYEVAAFIALVWHLVDAGRPEDSLHVLDRAMDVFVEQNSTYVHLKIAWLRGRILAAMNIFAAAEDEIVRARDGFLEQGRGFQAALASLELGWLYAKTKRVTKLQACIAGTLRLFQALRVPQESAAAVLLLEAARRETEAETLLRQALRRLDARGPSGLEQSTSFRF